MVSEGMRYPDVIKEEPNFDTIVLLGITSGTTGEPKMAMLSHMNFLSGITA
jgi:long-subunit acyl-CoA synthetase (AMP-forming)